MDDSDRKHVSTRQSRTSAIPLIRMPPRLGLAIVATLGLVLALLFVTPRAPQNGFAWDLLMVAGLLGAALVAALPLVSPRLWHHYGGDPRVLRSVLYWHADMAYVAVALALVHTVGLVVLDTTNIEYLKLSAPWSMLAALAAIVLLLIVLISSWYRIALKIRYRSWRLWHVGMSLAATGLMAFHVIDAGYYVNSPAKLAVFATLIAGPSLMALADGAFARGHARSHAAKSGESHIAAFGFPATRAGSARVVVLVCTLLFVAAITVAIPQAGSRAEAQANACLAEPCG